MISSAKGRRPLKQATVPVVSLSTCRRPDWLGSEFTLTENMMCAGYEHGGIDTCQVRWGNNDTFQGGFDTCQVKYGGIDTCQVRYGGIDTCQVRWNFALTSPPINS